MTHPNTTRTVKDTLTSGQLIDALKNGATLRWDVYQKEEERYQYLVPYEKGSPACFVTGWGSAIGAASDRLLHIMNNPEQWEIDPDCDYKPSHPDTAQLVAFGEYLLKRIDMDSDYLKSRLQQMANEFKGGKG